MRHDSRTAEKDLWIYGINPVGEALRSGRRIITLYILAQKGHAQDIVGAARTKGIPVKAVDRKFFDERFPKGHQGIAAVVEKKKTIGIEELLEMPGQKGEVPFFLILDLIEDPRNFGALLRVADSAGMHGVVFQSHRSAGLTPLVAKASAGALEHVHLVEMPNIKHAMEKMRRADIALIGAEAGAERTLWDTDMRLPLALVVGSEGEGLRRTVRELCDAVVTLPQQGAVNSLNVSVAAGILAYEVLRQRRA
ncbi:MAG: 23S rRNA (guanosine(2251)-2'-O)-methyltransferase RlmB [Thermodesulfovibrionales bacterium]